MKAMGKAAMAVTYQPWLVLLSIAMAIQGAYVGLSLSVQIGDAIGMRRRLLVAGAAFSLAVAIWTMHFVGMLAVRLPFPIDYLVFPTLLSFLVCVIVVAAAVYATSSRPLTHVRLALASCLTGAGIFTMHYIGMSALHASAHVIHAWGYVAASLVIAIAASGLALWLATGQGARPPLILSAIAFGIAVSGMHYTAMEGVTLFPHAAPPVRGAPALSTDLLAIVVAIVAFCVSAIFLLALMPDRGRLAPDTLPGAINSPPTIPAEPMPAGSVVAPQPQAVPGSAGAGDDPELGRGTYAPLGGLGAPPRRFARHLPFERNGTTHFLAVDDVVAIHASAHYSYIFDGQAKLFCPLAIGEVESRLDSERFLRIHRSHIINIDRVIGCKRSGDGDIVELDAPEHYAVPVSRSRVGRVKSRITSKIGAAK